MIVFTGFMIDFHWFLFVFSFGNSFPCLFSLFPSKNIFVSIQKFLSGFSSFFTVY